jgi:hypothetical protein
MKSQYEKIRRGSVLVALGAAFLVAGCGDAVSRLLEAKNPAAINETQLDNPQLVDILVNSTINALQNMYTDPFIWRGSMITDEQITGINWEQTARLNQRIVNYTEGDANGMFSSMQRYRWMADSSASRLRTLIPNATKDKRLALVLAHAGYGYVLMAEVECEATINVGADIYSPKELAQLALPKFEEAITVANAANAPDIANLARVGLARANLLIGDNAKVMQYATQVPANFTWWVEYKVNAGENYLYSTVTGGNYSLGVSPHFLNGAFGTQNLVATQTDPRIQHTTSWGLGHNRLTMLYKPYQSLPFSGYNGETIATGGKPILYERDTNVKLASYLEAMHDYYEAAGPNGTGPLGSTLEFVNARRAYGNQASVNLTGRDLMLELHEQRGRDMYLGGFRLGDLRRWMTQDASLGGGNYFPTGTHPTAGWGLYGDATCYPIPVSEYEGNPNIKKTG